MNEQQKQNAIKRIVKSRLEAMSLEDLMFMFTDKETELLSILPPEEIAEIFKDEFGYSHDE
jgi:hypothetical protein